MLNTRTFADILASTTSESATSESLSDTDFSSGWESHLDPFGLGHIIQLMTDSRIPHPYISPQKAYQSKRPAPTTFAQPSQKASSRPQRPSHQLNTAQRAAFNTLKTYSPYINDNYNLHELKSSYRTSVLKTHPDHGGNSESFQEVKKSYQILLALVKN